MPLILSTDKIEFEVKNGDAVAPYGATISRVEDTNEIFRLYSGTCKDKKIYFIEFKKPALHYDLSKFRCNTEVERKLYVESRLVINSILAKDTILYLPPHLKCYIVEQDLANVSIYEGRSEKQKSYSLVAPKGNYLQKKSQPVPTVSVLPSPVAITPKTNPSLQLSTPKNIPSPVVAKPRVIVPPTPRSSPSFRNQTISNVANKMPSLFFQSTSKKMLDDLKKTREQRLVRSESKVNQNREKPVISVVKNHKKRKTMLTTDIAPTPKSTTMKKAEAPKTTPTRAYKKRKAECLARSSSSSNLSTSSSSSSLVDEMIIPRIPQGSQRERRMTGTQNLRSWLQTQKDDGWEHQTDTIVQWCEGREKSTDEHYRCNGIVILPTGTGKTGTMGKMIGYSGEVLLVLVPARKLKQQSEEDIPNFAPDGTIISKLENIRYSKTQKKELKNLYKQLAEKVEKEAIPKKEHHDLAEYKKIKAKCKEFNHQYFQDSLAKSHVVIATYQFMLRHYTNFPWGNIDGVAFDEAHHLPSKEYRKMFLHIRDREQREVLGFTATPTKRLFHLFNFKPDGSDNPFRPFAIRRAIDKGVLAPMQTGLLVLEHDKNDKVRLANGHYSEAKVQRKLNRPTYCNTVVDFLLNNKSPATNQPLREMQSFIICSGIDHILSVHQVLKNAITVDQLDPEGVLRETYAKNIAAKEKITLEAARLKANATYSVCEPYYTSRNNQDPSQDAFDDNLNRFEMGGVQFLVLCNTLGEGYSNKKLIQCILFRIVSSEELLTQMGGRGSRVDPEYPEKVAHVIQVVTTDVGSNFELYAEKNFLIDGHIHFQYGVLPPKKADKFLAPIAMEGPKVASSVKWECPEEIKISAQKRIKRKNKMLEPISEKKERKPKRKRHGDFVTHSKEELLKLIADLEVVFKAVESAAIDEAEEAVEVDDVMEDITVEKKARPNDSLERKKRYRASAEEAGLKTLIKEVERRLNKMDSILNPIKKSLGGIIPPFDRKATGPKEQIPLLTRVQDLCMQAKKMASTISAIRKHNLNQLGAPMIIEEEPMPETLEESIQFLSKQMGFLIQELDESRDVLKQHIKEQRENSRLSRPYYNELKSEAPKINKKSKKVIKDAEKEDIESDAKEILEEMEKEKELSLFELMEKLNEPYDKALKKIKKWKGKRLSELSPENRTKRDKDHQKFHDAQSNINYLPDIWLIKLKKNPDLITSRWKGSNLLQAIFTFLPRYQYTRMNRSSFVTLLEQIVRDIPESVLTAKNDQGQNVLDMLMEFANKYDPKFSINYLNIFIRILVLGLMKRNMDCDYFGAQPLAITKNTSTNIFFRAFASNNWNSIFEEWNTSLLHELCYLPSSVSTTILNQSNININLQLKNGNTPLMEYFKNFRYCRGSKGNSALNAIRILIKKQANWLIQNTEGKTAFQYLGTLFWNESFWATRTLENMPLFTKETSKQFLDAAAEFIKQILDGNYYKKHPSKIPILIRFLMSKNLDKAAIEEFIATVESDIEPIYKEMLSQLEEEKTKLEKYRATIMSAHENNQASQRMVNWIFIDEPRKLARVILVEKILNGFKSVLGIDIAPESHGEKIESHYKQLKKENSQLRNLEGSYHEKNNPPSMPLTNNEEFKEGEKFILYREEKDEESSSASPSDSEGDSEEADASEVDDGRNPYIDDEAQANDDEEDEVSNAQKSGSEDEDEDENSENSEGSDVDDEVDTNDDEEENEDQEGSESLEGSDIDDEADASDNEEDDEDQEDSDNAEESNKKRSPYIDDEADASDDDDEEENSDIDASETYEDNEDLEENNESEEEHSHKKQKRDHSSDEKSDFDEEAEVIAEAPISTGGKRKPSPGFFSNPSPMETESYKKQKLSHSDMEEENDEEEVVAMDEGISDDEVQILSATIVPRV